MTADHIQVLKDFLGSASIPKGILSLPELDGYLTAIVIAPQLIQPSEWIPGIWGGDAPDFGDISQVQTILGAVMARYNEIISQLDANPLEFRPLYLPDDPGERASTELVGLWAQGFWKGMLLHAHDWYQLLHDDEARVMLAPIMCFVQDNEGKYILRVEPEELDDLLIDAGDLIPQVVPVIQDYWKLRSQPSPSPPRSSRTGRNAPCPCGSGLKYKRCCGAN
jgi:uncharacterized protein